MNRDVEFYQMVVKEQIHPFKILLTNRNIYKYKSVSNLFLETYK